MIRFAAGLFLLLYLSSSTIGQGLNTDRIYQETVEPLQRENYNLKLQVVQYRDVISALTKENADLKKKLEGFEKPEPPKPDTK
jgi:FtsZ-binding cell division protein ZapB